MKGIDPKIILTGILLVFSLVSGFWLTSTGRPLNTVIFTIHKLIALAGIVFSIIVINNLRKGAEINAAVLTALICAGVFVVMTVASGAFLSFEKPAHIAFKIMHKAGPVLFTASVAAAVILLKKN